MSDRESNEKMLPGFKRFNLLKDIDFLLRRGQCVHETFVNNNGLQTFYNWLVEMPDGTYPNQKIVYTILQQLERMDIEKEILIDAESKDIENALQMYSSGVAGSGYQECAGLAK